MDNPFDDLPYGGLTAEEIDRNSRMNRKDVEKFKYDFAVELAMDGYSPSEIRQILKTVDLWDEI